MVSSLERLSRLRDRYADLVSDRFYAMVPSSQFSKAQKKWLRVVGRTRPFESIDDWVERETIWKNEDAGSFGELTSEVDALSSAFALTPWHVLWAIFVREHQPGSDLFKMFPVDVKQPRARILIAGSNIRLAQKLNQLAIVSGVCIEVHPGDGLQPDPGGADVPLVSVGLPIELPSELARRECNRALRAARDILRIAGLPMPHRVREEPRNSIATSLVLRAADSRLPTTLIPACRAVGLPVRSEMTGRTSRQSDTLLSGLYLEVRFLPTVQSGHLSTAATRMLKDSRLAVKSAGLDLGDRLRPSVLAKQSQSLGVNGQKAPKRGLGDLAERLLGDFPAESGNLTPVGRRATTTLKSRRNKVKRRFERKGLVRRID